MDENKVIHETVVQDVIDLVGAGSEILKGVVPNRKKSFKSLASAANKLILVFPYAASENMTIDTATMGANANEKKMVLLLQILFSAMNLTTAQDGIDYIKQFHTNVDFGDNMTLDDFMSGMDQVVGKISESVDMEAYNKVKEDMKNINYFFEESVSESSLSDYYRTRYSGYDEIINEAEKSGLLDTPKSSVNDVIKGIEFSEKKVGDGLKDAANGFRNQLIPSDVAKANEAMPTTMVVNFTSKLDDGRVSNSNIVIGVKCKIYPISSDDLLARIVMRNRSSNGLINFIRSTTREISFVRDFLLCVDRAKLDASKSRNSNTVKMMKVLERRAMKSKIRRKLGQVNDASAITTLAITQDEVSYLKKTENIKLDDPATARKIMEGENFMQIQIFDESNETMKSITDTGKDVFESVSFRQLERQSSDGAYKKVLNLVGRMR